MYCLKMIVSFQQTHQDNLLPHIQLDQYHTIQGQFHKQVDRICAVLVQILLARGLGYVPGAPRLFTSDETHE